MLKTELEQDYQRLSRIRFNPNTLILVNFKRYLPFSKAIANIIEDYYSFSPPFHLELFQKTWLVKGSLDQLSDCKLWQYSKFKGIWELAPVPGWWEKDNN